MNHYTNLCDTRCPSHSGILAGTCKGRKWIFPAEDPYLAITYSYCVGGCGVFGELHHTVEEENFIKHVWEELKKDGIQEFEFSCEGEELTNQLLQILKDKEVLSEEELSFRYEKPEIKSDTTKNEGFINRKEEYSISAVDKVFLQQKENYKNLPFLMERLSESWEEEQDFLEKGIAFITLFKNEIVGVILGSGRYEQYIAIDIEVMNEHRRKGLAEKMTLEFIKACEEKQLIAQWDCIESNIASRKLAEKTGFTFFKKRPYYWCNI